MDGLAEAASPASFDHRPCRIERNEARLVWPLLAGTFTQARSIPITRIAAIISDRLDHCPKGSPDSVNHRLPAPGSSWSTHRPSDPGVRDKGQGQLAVDILDPHSLSLEDASGRQPAWPHADKHALEFGRIELIIVDGRQSRRIDLKTRSNGRKVRPCKPMPTCASSSTTPEPWPRSGSRDYCRLVHRFPVNICHALFV